MTAQFGGHKARGQDRAYVSPVRQREKVES